MKKRRLIAATVSAILLLFSITAAAAEDLETWSTNFADLTSLEGAEIRTWINDTQLSVDTVNVNSGGKSIRNAGRVDNQHLLQTVFKIQSLTGEDAVDLSAKTLSIEMFVPNGSPLSFFSIELVSGNNSIIAKANIPPQKGRWYSYEVDINLVVALGSWQIWDWMHSSGISSREDAVNLLQSVQYMRINAQPDSSTHNATDAYFLIDNLGWKPSGDLPAYDASRDSLRKYGEARNLLVGGYLDPSASTDPSYMRIFLQQFHSMATGTFWPAAEPTGKDLYAEVRVPADDFLDNVFTMMNSPLVRYALGGMDTPGWLITKSYEEARPALKNHVGAQVSSHKGKTGIWYVLNELLRYDLGWGSYRGLGVKDRTQRPPLTWGNNYSPFSSSPSDVSMVEDAYRAAREADSDALLFLNEGGVEEMGQMKPDAFYNLVAKLVKDGAQIDGVGLQAHLMIDKDGRIHASSGGTYALKFNPTDGLVNVARNVERYKALGLKVIFSEVDVAIWMKDIDSTPAGQKRLAERLALQAQVYRSLLKIALTHSNVEAFILWTWADQYAWWITGTEWTRDYGSPGIFDLDYRPKPAYYALLDEFRGK